MALKSPPIKQQAKKAVKAPVEASIWREQEKTQVPVLAPVRRQAKEARRSVLEHVGAPGGLLPQDQIRAKQQLLQQ